jgi:2-polyprenyl-6-methoxyphenol hydroxylase-like FAD-dependent oxidoreductase
MVLIAGGGPAGMMLGYLLAGCGVEVTVFEKHADFLRDFRGDTVHPSTLEVIDELGLAERFLARPHDEIREVRGAIGGEGITLADMRHLPVHHPFVALMPQWDFLDFLADEARQYSTFHLEMETEAVGVVERDGRVVGLTVKHDGRIQDRDAELVVAADGRHSTIRDAAGFSSETIGSPIDVLWLRLPKPDEATTIPLGNVVAGRLFVTLDRGDYLQCAFVIDKGAFDDVKAAGLAAFREEIARVAPHLRESAETVTDWDQVKLLTVTIDRLRRWHRPGLLCIGDAAHAMSPIGGIGINLAIQDAVAAANLLAAPLLAGRLTDADLAAVETRRRWPTRVTQRVQATIQDQIIQRILRSTDPIRGVPFPLRFFRWFPILRRIPARFIGLGVRPEHISPDLPLTH